MEPGVFLDLPWQNLTLTEKLVLTEQNPHLILSEPFNLWRWDLDVLIDLATNSLRSRISGGSRNSPFEYEIVRAILIIFQFSLSSSADVPPSAATASTRLY